ncbi:MAG TPA: pilus assembly protein PilM [Candidatus Saccharimonadales bacterium]|nr:pilus assembly protein PilM [Candidatus Saccharimonadales bacterium]
MGFANFYHDEPLFGLDIGWSTIKVIQLDLSSPQLPKVLGWGITKFDPSAINNGVITNFDAVSKAMYELFKKEIHGSIYTRRVVCSLPTSHTFSRLIKLPAIADKDIAGAIKLEAEQYIPMPTANLYIDYEIASRGPEGIELLMMATPKTIVDSYVKLLAALDLELVALEPSINSTARLFNLIEPVDGASMLVDLGAAAIDVAVFDKIMIINSTIPGGSDLMTKLVSEKLNTDTESAFEMRSKYGIGISQNQQQIEAAIEPVLENLLKEIRKVSRYYTDRAGHSQRKIARIITSGGGANMPGINQYLAKQIELPTTTLDPWKKIDFGHLKRPSSLEQAAFNTAAGEALLDPPEIYR